LTSLLGLVFLLLVAVNSGAAERKAPLLTVPDVEGWEVVSVEVNGLTVMKTSYFLELLDMPSGTAFSPERLRRGLSRIYRKELFRDLRVEALRMEPEGRSMVLRVTCLSSRTTTATGWQMSRFSVQECLNGGSGRAPAA